MFCKNCGTQIPDGSVFCSVCGCPVETYVEVPTKKPINKKIIIISVAAVLLVVIGITLLVTLTGYKIDKALVGEWLDEEGLEDPDELNEFVFYKNGTGKLYDAHSKTSAYFKITTKDGKMSVNFEEGTFRDDEWEYKIINEKLHLYENGHEWGVFIPME